MPIKWDSSADFKLLLNAFVPPPKFEWDKVASAMGEDYTAEACRQRVQKIRREAAIAGASNDEGMKSKTRNAVDGNDGNDGHDHHHHHHDDNGGIDSVNTAAVPPDTPRKRKAGAASTPAGTPKSAAGKRSSPVKRGRKVREEEEEEKGKDEKQKMKEEKSGIATDGPIRTEEQEDHEDGNKTEQKDEEDECDCNCDGDGDIPV